jgi:hypothetical protein
MDRWAHLDDGSDPDGRAAAEKYVEQIAPATTGASPTRPEPRTAAGQAMEEWLREREDYEWGRKVTTAILAIEAEAAPALDVDRLTAALAASGISSMSFENVRAHLTEIAADYARLSTAPEPAE